MTPLGMTILWAVLLVAFTVIEAVTVQVVSIWFALGALAGLICNLCSLEVWVQVTVFIGVTFIALIFTRPLVRRFMKGGVQKTNADRAIGAEGIVLERIDNLGAKGQVKIQGSVWTARSSNGSIIEADEIVVVDQIEGVKLLVSKK